MKNFLLGAVAGALATVPMTAFWEFMHWRLPGEPRRPLPPREVTEGLAVKAGVRHELPDPHVEMLTLAGHFGYGALAGALFGLVAPRDTNAAVITGMSFGAGVWAVSYLGWLPATGVRHPPQWDPPTRTRLAIASHLVWGASAGLVVSTLRRE